MPLSTVRREAVELLCAAQADGRISVELFETRLAAVQQATSDAAVQAIIADLLDDHAAGLPVPYDLPAPPVPFEERIRLSAVLSNTRREGNWVVPWRLELMTVLGEAHLDFREAWLPDPLIEVDLSATLGSVVLIVPKGTAIVNQVEATLGSNEFKRKGKSVPAPNGLTLKVTGHLLLGSLEILEK